MSRVDINHTTNPRARRRGRVRDVHEQFIESVFGELTQFTPNRTSEARAIRIRGQAWAATAAVRELGERAASAVPLLIELLGRKDYDDDLPKFIEALVDIGAKAKPALPALSKLLEHKRSDVREAAKDAILHIEMMGQR